MKENISLADKTWFKTGGCARFFAEPSSATALHDALAFAQKGAIPVHILGDGANTLVSDEGFSGLIIKPAFNEMAIIEQSGESVSIRAGSGVKVGDLIEYCLSQGAIGLEEFSGIPGTVGGSVYNNLHYFEYAFSDFVTTAEIMNISTGVVDTVGKEWFNFGYDFSKLHAKEHVVLSVTFTLKSADALAIAYARGRRVEIIRHRVKRFPQTNTCGCFFRNFHENEVTLVINGRKMIYVAYYLEMLGVKGTLRVGNAMVSSQHANMIITLSDAKSADIIAVARTMQELVLKQYGIIPKPECELVGFTTYPLLGAVEKN